MMDGDTKNQHLAHAGYTLDQATQLWMPPPTQGDMTLDEAWEHFTNPPVHPNAAAQFDTDPLTNAAVDRLQDDLRDGDDRQGGVAV